MIPMALESRRVDTAAEVCPGSAEAWVETKRTLCAVPIPSPLGNHQYKGSDTLIQYLVLWILTLAEYKMTRAS
jgi:hypothetical protein